MSQPLAGSSRQRRRRSEAGPARIGARTGIAAPSILLGAGIGGSLEQVAFHQLLQWHGMLTERHPTTSLENVERNLTAGGLFQLLTLTLIVAGVFTLWYRARRGGWRWTARSLAGWMLVGWGSFALIEGAVNHHLLQLHRVNPAAEDPLAWDLGYLGVSALVAVTGWLIARTDRPRDLHEMAGDDRR